jgi:hypothetical protein
MSALIVQDVCTDKFQETCSKDSCGQDGCQEEGRTSQEGNA